MSYASKAKYRYEFLQILDICMVLKFTVMHVMERSCSHFTLLTIWSTSFYFSEDTSIQSQQNVGP